VQVLLVDDHQLVLEGLRALFRHYPQWTICGEARDGREAVELVAKLKPDLVVLDLSMPTMNGIQAAAKIREISPQTKIIMLSMHGPSYAEREALRAGVDAYLTKSNAGPDLMRVIRELFKDTES
jgi:DNA-binding NarL/FixJ family response regulator